VCATSKIARAVAKADRRILVISKDSSPTFLNHLCSLAAGRTCTPFGSAKGGVGIRAVVVGGTAIMSCPYGDLKNGPLAKILSYGVHRANVLVYDQNERLEALVNDATSVDGAEADAFVTVASYVISSDAPVLAVAKRCVDAAATPRSLGAGSWAAVAECIWSIANGGDCHIAATLVKELEAFAASELGHLTASASDRPATIVRCYEVAEAVAKLTPRADLIRALELCTIAFIKPLLSRRGFARMGADKVYARKRTAIWTPTLKGGVINYVVKSSPDDAPLDAALPASIAAALRKALDHVHSFECARLVVDHSDQAAIAAQRAHQEIADIRNSAAKEIAERPADAESIITAMGAAVRERYPPEFTLICTEMLYIDRDPHMKHCVTVTSCATCPDPVYQRVEPPAELTTVGVSPLR
jgi:hypothetical protein